MPQDAHTTPDEALVHTEHDPSTTPGGSSRDSPSWSPKATRDEADRKQEVTSATSADGVAQLIFSLFVILQTSQYMGQYLNVDVKSSHGARLF